MKELKIEKFTLQTIADAVKGADVKLARSLLSFATGAVWMLQVRCKRSSSAMSS